MKAYISEFLGTYALVFFGTGAIVIDDLYGSISHLGVALAFGLVVMAMIYSFGHISGAHINPAVSLAFWAANKFPTKKLIPYVFTQLLAAGFASFSLMMLFPDHPNLGATLPTGSAAQSFLLEFIMSLFLMLVILKVSSGARETGIIAGMAIGGVVMLEALVGGPVSGASMNPARSLGPALVSGSTQHLWLYVIAPISGMISAVFIEKAMPD